MENEMKCTIWYILFQKYEIYRGKFSLICEKSVY